MQMNFKESNLTEEKLKTLSESGDMHYITVISKKEEGRYFEPLVEESFRRQKIKPLSKSYMNGSWYYFGKKEG